MVYLSVEDYAKKSGIPVFIVQRWADNQPGILVSNKRLANLIELEDCKQEDDLD